MASRVVNLMAVAIMLAPVCVKGQWSGGPTGPVWYKGGSIGIGTASPSAPLEVNGLAIFGAGAQPAMPPGQSFLTGVNPSGDIPGLVLYNSGGGGGASVSLDFYNTTYNCNIPQAKVKAIDDGSYSDNLLFLSKAPGGPCNGLVERMRIASSGNVGINVQNPVHQLQVGGTIGAQEIIVSSTGADYVFEPDYRLAPLSEVKHYIEEHHHLPDIPSAAEVKEKGLSVGEMQARLLAKVEELTLHLIQVEEQNRELRNRLAQVEERVAAH